MERSPWDDRTENLYLPSLGRYHEDGAQPDAVAMVVIGAADSRGVRQESAPPFRRSITLVMRLSGTSQTTATAT